MVKLPLEQTTPLVQEADGTVYVSGTRVTLDTLVGAFEDGATAEQIADSFPSLSLRDIYGAIAHYLQHPSEVAAYLADRQNDATRVRHEIEQGQDTAAFREHLRNRRRVHPAHR